jgi:hypothetical protein
MLEHLVALPVRAGAGARDIGIDMSVCHKEIEKAVVVGIDEPDAPTEGGPKRRREASAEADIDEQPISLIAIERRCNPGKSWS